MPREASDVEHSTLARLRRSVAARSALAAVAVALAVVAQLQMDAWRLWWTIPLFLVAAALLAVAARGQPISIFTLGSSRASRVEAKVPARRDDAEHLAGATGFALGMAALGLSLGSFAGGPPYTLAWWLYGGAVLLIALALPSLDGRWTALVNRWRVGRPLSIDGSTLLQWLALGMVLVLAALLRTYHLGELPAGLWYDEADNLATAVQFQRDPGSIPVFATSTNLPSLFLMPIAVVANLAGVSITTPRLAAVAFGLGGIVAIFLLGRLLFGPLLGLVAAFLAAVMRWDINWSRIGMHGITTPLFTSLTAYLTLRAVRSGRLSDFGFAGASLGLGMWFYTPLRLFPAVVAFLLLYSSIVHHTPIRRLAGQVLVIAGVAVAIASPVLQSAALHPDEFFARTRVTSVFSSSPAGEALGNVRSSLGKHALMFNRRGDPNPRHNIPGRPMLDVASGVLFVLGLGLALARWRNVALAGLPVWVFVMTAPGALTLPWEAPQSLRGIGSTPAVLLCITVAIGALWRTVRSAPWPAARWWAPAALAAALGGIAFLNVHAYFGEQARDPEVYAAFSTDETLMARGMVEQQRQGYSLMASRQFLFSLTTTLLADSPPYEVIRPPGDIPIEASQVSMGVAVYLEPREGSVYRLLRAYYPDGAYKEVRPPGGGRVLLYTAAISREQLYARHGLSARYTLPDGAVRQDIRTSTQAAWTLEARREDVPFDFSWQGTLHVTEPGQYRLLLEGATDAEVLLDGRPMLGGERREVAIVPAVGLHTLEVHGRVRSPEEELRLLWEPPGGPGGPIPGQHLYHGSVRPVGLAGRFFKSGVEAGVPDASQVTHAMDIFYYDPVLPEPYLAVWDGTLEVPTGGDYGFWVDGFGTARLYLDGSLIAQDPPGPSAGPVSRASLAAGGHRIRVEYSPTRPPSQLEVLWAPPGAGFEPIPIERLSPATEHMFRVVGAGGE